MMRFFFKSVLIVGMIGFCAEVQAQTLAFPGAEGFGRFAKGGRGGKVIEVSRLDDPIPPVPGTLRYALEASGPRTVIFRVGGTITLNDRIVIVNGFLTIAGQTAPGDGITVKGKDIQISASEVIVRHLRVRTGITGLDPGIPDSLSITPRLQNLPAVTDVILDHCSLSWAEDEVFAINWPTDDITVQWSIMAEGLNEVGGSPGRALLVGGFAKNISIHHNLLISNADRNPSITSGNVDFVNNIIYNYGRDVSLIYAYWGPLLLNWVKNYYIGGPMSTTYKPVRFIGAQISGGVPYLSQSLIYLSGNRHLIHRPNDTYPEDSVVMYTDGPPYPALTTTRHNYPLVTTTDVDLAKNQVLADAGANRVIKSDGTFRTYRDVVDRRYVNEVLTLTGPTVVFNPSNVGGYPVLSNGTPPPDSDHDGMPDSWELLHGFNPSDPSDGPKDADGDGYTNLEEYLNGDVNVGSGGNSQIASPTNLIVN